MKYLIILYLLVSIPSYSQDAIGLRAKRDSVSGKYGFVNRKGEFIIAPQFELARNFMSEFTSVKMNSRWGIIDTTGNFRVKPTSPNAISAIYRDHYIEYGEHMKFKNMSGKIKYEYLFIPGPFREIEEARDTLDTSRIEDYELIRRVMEMYELRFCHYYEVNRIYNAIAIGNEWAAMETIKFVLDNPTKVANWISSDKKFEKDFENGEIDCCGYGPVWYGE